MSPRAERLVAVAVVALVLLLFVGLALGWRSCALSGGHYVRGVVWMECIR